MSTRQRAGFPLIAVSLVVAGIGVNGLLADDAASPAATATTTTAAQTTTSAGVAPTAEPTTPSAPSTSPPTSPPTVGVTEADETAEEFLALFLAAFESGDADFLLARLHAATTDIYGVDQCGTYLEAQAAAGLTLTDVAIGDSGPWDYVIDGITTEIEHATTVQAVVGGSAAPTELHWALVDGTYRWFSDCGDPLG